MPMLTNQRSRLLGGGTRYLLRDEYTTARAAGAVNGTAPEPGPGGNRTVTDTTGANVTIANGELAVKGDGSWVHEKLHYATTATRVAGLTLRFDLNNVDGAMCQVAFRANTANSYDSDNIGLKTDTSRNVLIRRTTDGGSANAFTMAANTYYTFWLVLRNTGKYVFVKDAADSIIRLLFFDEWVSTATMYVGAPDVLTNAKTIKFKGVRIPKGKYYAVQAQASDSFARADGVIGSTDGAGHAEANSGSGKAWTNQVGAYTIATNKAASSTIDTVAITTVDTGDVNAFLRVKATRAGGNVGVVLRYADASNYVYAYHDGTNVALIKRVAGVESNVVAPVAATYAAGGYITVTADGTAFRLYYNELLIGTGTISDAGLQTGTAHGLYSTNSGNTFDDFAIFARRGYSDLEAF